VSERRDLQTEHVARVRVGHGANCSSIGSVVDTLFASAVAGAAIFAAVVAALNTERVHVVRPPKSRTGEPQGRAP
jgi:hypothetical protein